MLARQVGQKALGLNAQWARLGAAVDFSSQIPAVFSDKKDDKPSASPSLPLRQHVAGLSTLAMSQRARHSVRSAALDQFLTRSMSTSSDTAVQPAAKGSNVGLYLGGLAALHVLWTMGGVDWMVSLNTSFVQSAVWITALSLISPASLWTSLKRHEHVENEKKVRGAQLSSGVKFM